LTETAQPGYDAPSEYNDPPRLERETKPIGSETVFGPQHLDQVQMLAKDHQEKQARETTLLHAAYTGTGSIINSMA
jgi:hypothetical protein